ncbi:MAG: hypothetical protein PHN84_04605 [Desulfuromonadaceae bacterium]|nr:hypothetical protein [Desulfuromonadaceae bacterium]MDD2856059.1 hypothetical protein [Desulfuromonadaceae bacterium]
MEDILLVSGLVVFALIVSIPCGYIRQNYPKYSFMWFLLIHLPIPFIVLVRIKSGVSWHIIPLTLAGSVAGQIFGAAVSRRRRNSAETS